MSSAFDRLDNPYEAALYDADPDGYHPPRWEYARLADIRYVE